MNVRDILASLIHKFAEKGSHERQFALRDILTDLEHIADDMGLDFEGAVIGAHQVYLDEVKE